MYHITTGSNPTDSEGVTDKPVDMAVVSNFIPRMASKWDAIGTQLDHSILVQNLRSVPGYVPESVCEQVIGAAKESGSLPNYGVLLKVLSSERVDLAQVASDLVVAVKESLREDARRSDATLPSTNGDSQPPEPSTPTDTSDTAPIL